MTPEFDKRGARVMRSPYLASDCDDDPDGRLKEYFRLQDAITGDIKDYDDLKGDAKRIFDRAEAVADAELPTMLSGESIPDFWLRQRLTEYDDGMFTFPDAETSNGTALSTDAGGADDTSGEESPESDDPTVREPASSHMEESTTYQAMLEEGFKEGAIQEARKLLLLLGCKKLGQPGARTLAALDKIVDLARLEALIDRLELVETWHALLAEAPAER